MRIRLSRPVNKPGFYKIASYGWLGLTCFLLFRPGRPFEDPCLFSGEDKLAHFVLFLVLSCLWGLNFKFVVGMKKGQSLQLSGLLATIFAAFSEWIQSYIPYRAMGFGDFVFDELGIVAGVLLFFFGEKRLNHL